MPVLIRRHLHLVIALLLPLMLLRGLLPEGYMAAAGADGTLRVVMCGDGLQPADGGDANDPQPATPAAGGECLFAHASFTAPLAEPPGRLAPPLQRFAPPAARTSSREPAASGPLRADSARAPPAFSA